MRPCRFQCIVGYQNLNLKAGGQTMAAPTFLEVSSTTGCTLADLTVSGYTAEYYDENEEDYVGGVAPNAFVLMFLSSTGVASARYYWIDAPLSKGISAGWYTDETGTAIEGGAASVAIEAGQALWIRGSGNKLTTAGAVGELDVEFQTRNGGQTAVGNCTPVDLTLGQMLVTGYTNEYYDENEEDYVGGVAPNAFVVMFLSSTGVASDRYYWIDAPKSKGISAGWYSDETGKAIEGGATSVSVPAGQGLWVRGGGNKLYIPAPAL